MMAAGLTPVLTFVAVPGSTLHGFPVVPRVVDSTRSCLRSDSTSRARRFSSGAFRFASGRLLHK